jgi:hypothetical protein
MGTFLPVHVCPSLLCVRCQAGLLPPLNMEHRSDAKVNHRTQRLLADLPMSRHANDHEQHLLMHPSATRKELRFNAEVLYE